jgi:hypothetical protein
LYCGFLEGFFRSAKPISQYLMWLRASLFMEPHQALTTRLGCGCLLIKTQAL